MKKKIHFHNVETKEKKKNTNNIYNKYDQRCKSTPLISIDSLDDSSRSV